MLWVGIVFTALASLIHVYIFVLESMRWTDPKTMATFGVTAADAEVTKSMAFNQGFYNLFLAIMGFAGIGFLLADRREIGGALVLAGTLSMTLAGIVLVLSTGKVRSAMVQMVPAVLAVLFTIWGLS